MTDGGVTTGRLPGEDGLGTESVCVRNMAGTGSGEVRGILGSR